MNTNLLSVSNCFVLEDSGFSLNRVPSFRLMGVLYHFFEGESHLKKSTDKGCGFEQEEKK